MVTPPVYQFRVVLERVSPMVWRRIFLRSDSSIADLHYIIQIAMGWQDDHLHRFRIHGKEYGVYQPGGILFSDDPERVKLSDFRFRLGEYFFYEYDFTRWWKHKIRLEKVLEPNPRRFFPECIAGNRLVPSETSDRPPFSHRSPIAQVPKLLSKILKGESFTERDLHRLRQLQVWLNRNRLDREAINHRLRQYAAGDDEWRWE